jgi:hypothetical protein
MSYIKTPTPTQARQNERDRQVLRIAEALNHTASIMTSASKAIYSGDPVQLVADLNADLENSVALMTANKTLGLGINTHLDTLDLPKYAKRVPLEIGHPHITLTAEGFVYTAPED